MEALEIENWVKLIAQITAKVPLTLVVTGISLFFGLWLGLVIAMVRLGQNAILRAMATFVISFVRCTPVLVQLFLVFYGLPQVLLVFHIDINDWDALVFALLTFSLHIAAFLSEMIRSSFLAVGKDQFDAAYSIGMSYLQAMRRIILPQMAVHALPNFGNNAITLLKETSVAFTIGVVDMMGQARIYLGNNYGMNMFEIYILISLFYWLICIAIERGIGRMEKVFCKER